MFGEEPIQGTVTKWVPGDGESSALWHIQHEDGDEEDLEEQEAADAISLWTRASEVAPWFITR